MTILAEPVGGVIFDLGETLVSVPDVDDEEALIAEHCGFSIQQIRLMTYEICWNRKNLSEAAFAVLLTDSIVERGRHCDLAFVKSVFERSIVNIVVQQDALRCLQALKKRSKRIAIVSNSNPLSHSRIARAGFTPYIDAVLLSCDTGFWKPDPRAYLHAFDVLGYAPQQMLIVGDRVRTLALGGIQTGAQIVLVERRASASISSDQLPFAAVVPTLDDIVRAVSAL